jgi:hypothetical protein
MSSGLKSLGVACCILSALTSPAVLAQPKVDTVVTNGKNLTVDPGFSVVEALTIRLTWWCLTAIT